MWWWQLQILHVSLLFQNEDVGYPGRHSLGGSDGILGYIWMDWRCSDGIGGDDGLVAIDISIEPLNQISNVFPWQQMLPPYRF
jgi:hypothetical protein